MINMDDMDNLREFVSAYSSLVFRISLILIIFSTFFLFSNLFTEFYDIPKFLVLIILTGVLLLTLALKFVASGKMTVIRTPLDIPLLLLLAVGIFSTAVSPSPLVALLGNQLKIHGSLVSLTVYILFYFVVVNSLKSAREIRWILHLSLVGAEVLAVISLLSYSGLKILPSHTGSPFSTTAILALLIPFALVNIFSGSKPSVKIINSIFLALMGVTIALTGTWATWIGAVVGLIITVALISPIRQISHISQMSPISLISLISPITVIALVSVLSFVPPIGQAKNPIYTRAQNFPKEVQLGFRESWKISVSAFRDSPFWGTGPSSYLFDFTNYKPVEFNSSKVWNLRFDAPFNEYLQVLATLGGIGIVALLSLTALFLSFAYQTYKLYMSHRSDQSYWHLSLAVSGLVFFVILFLHSSSLSLWIMGLIILACFVKVNLSEGVQRIWGGGKQDIKTIFLQIAGVASVNSSQEIKVDALPGILLTVSLAIVFFAFFFGGKITLADYHHRLALNAVAQNQGIVTYNELLAAEKLNPYSDLYRTDLAQTNFALANAIAATKGPTEASPAGSLTDQDKQNIQVLLQQSINEGRAATTLSPRSAINWEILGLLYRQIAGVAPNALQFSLDSYGRAIFQDPLNPVLRVNVGGVYYAIKNYDLAIRFFTDAINLKPDFANGYYNLSVALRDKGDLANAQAIAGKLVTLVDSSSPDYKIATDYLNDLKTRSGQPPQPPAATASGQLQNEKLPKVVNVGNPPEKIATPEAVKK